MNKIDLDSIIKLLDRYGWKGVVIVFVILLAGAQIQYGGLYSQINQEVASTITAMQKEASYIVGVSGSNYYLMNGTGDRAGRVEWVSTNASAVINAAMNNLTNGRTWIETVYLKADKGFSLTNSIEIPSYTRLLTFGKVTLANGANCHMIKNKNQNTHDHHIVIEGGTFDGNYTGQTSPVDGFNFMQSESIGDNVDREIWLKNVAFINCYRCGINFSAYNPTANELFASNIHAVGIDSYGLWISGMTDGCIDGANYIGGWNEYALGLDGVYLTSFSGLKIDGCVTITQCSAITFGDFNIDSYARDADGLHITHTFYSQFSNGVIRASSWSGYNTKSAILIQAYSGYTDLHLQFSNIYLGRSDSSETQRWAYGINEDNGAGGTPNFNLYANIDATDALNGNHIIGANSSAVNCKP